MAKKRVSCRWCGMPSLVPFEANTLPCQACEGSTVIQSDYSGRLPYGDIGNAKSMSSNTYATNPGFAGYGPYDKSYQPVNTVRVYQLHAQPHAPPAHGRKRAVLCGINYDDLEGCINDVMNMRTILVERFGFPVSSILVLTEEEDYSRVPTKKNIRAALRWLVHGCQSGDSLVFHYSGHGGQVDDLDGDERDGNDECIMPVDHIKNGVILDDEINETIVRPLPRGATLHSTFDSCNSGTVLDLPYVFNIAKGDIITLPISVPVDSSKGRWIDNTTRFGAYKGSMGGKAICFSACEDNQNAKDSSSPTSPTGAMTTAFIGAIEAAFHNNEKITYQFILDYMHQTLMQAHNSGRLTCGISRMFDRRNLQDPLLSASEEFRTNKEFKL